MVLTFICSFVQHTFRYFRPTYSNTVTNVQLNLLVKKFLHLKSFAQCAWTDLQKNRKLVKQKPNEIVAVINVI